MSYKRGVVRRQVDGLTDYYVLHGILRMKSAPPVLIEAKRAQLQLHRLTKDNK